MRKNIRKAAKIKPEKFKIFGKHLTVDAYGADRGKLRHAKGIYDLLHKLPEHLGMHRLTTPYVVYDDWQMGRAKGDWGVSGFVMIYESHISCHTWPEMGYVSMDVYSCRDFDEKDTIKFLKEYWRAKQMKVRVISRG